LGTPRKVESEGNIAEANLAKRDHKPIVAYVKE
jgi:hypothetical protein